METRDYNGAGRWSRQTLLERYAGYRRALGVSPGVRAPREHAEGGVHWVYPVMEEVIAGIERGDPACIALGVDFLEEDQHLPFGKLLKSNTARALRRAVLNARPSPAAAPARSSGCCWRATCRTSSSSTSGCCGASASAT